MTTIFTKEEGLTVVNEVGNVPLSVKKPWIQKTKTYTTHTMLSPASLSSISPNPTAKPKGMNWDILLLVLNQKDKFLM